MCATLDNGIVEKGKQRPSQRISNMLKRLSLFIEVSVVVDERIVKLCLPTIVEKYPEMSPRNL